MYCRNTYYCPLGAVIAILMFLSAATLFAQPQIAPQLFASGLTNPTDIQHAGDSRLFVVERPGRIKIVDSTGVVAPTAFLNVVNRVLSGGERGLLGLAFHPNYNNNGYFFVNYINTSGNTVISRFTVDSTNAEVADTASELILMTINQPFTNHNGGALAFGPDGYLYIALGDGGSGGDPGNRAQNRQLLLGKMLRIDVNSGTPYAIPPDNPFVNDTTTLDEIWAIGFRNPWRFSFDRLTGDIWIGDVGQGQWEEVNFEPAGGTGGLNYGWRCYEGNATYNLSGCGPASDYTYPVITYPIAGINNCAVTGGYVYRGQEFPDLVGHYVYADFCSGRIWSLLPNLISGWDSVFHGQFHTSNYSTFGENAAGELFLGALAQGNIYKLIDECAGFSISTTSTPESCVPGGDAIAGVSISGSNGFPVINWSTGDQGSSTTGLSAGSYMVTVTDSIGCVRTSAVEIVQGTAAVDAGADLSICEGDTVTLQVTGAATNIQWSPSNLVDDPTSATTTAAPDSSILFIVEADDSLGCTGSDSVFVKVNVPEKPIIITQGDLTSYSSIDGTDHIWFFTGFGLSDTLVFETDTLQFQGDGYYMIQLTDSNGCKTSSDFEPIIGESIQEFVSSLFKLYPNPTSGKFTIEPSAGMAVEEYSIQHISGKVVANFTGEIPGKPLLIDKRLPAGMYIVRLLSNEKYYHLPLMVAE